MVDPPFSLAALLAAFAALSDSSSMLLDTRVESSFRCYHQAEISEICGIKRLQSITYYDQKNYASKISK